MTACCPFIPARMGIALTEPGKSLSFPPLSLCESVCRNAEVRCGKLTWQMRTVEISLLKLRPSWGVRRGAGRWFWIPFTLAPLKGFLISTAPVIQVAVELPALTELCWFYLCMAHFCLRQAGWIQNKISFCQTIPNGRPIIADTSRVEKAAHGLLGYHNTAVFRD